LFDGVGNALKTAKEGDGCQQNRKYSTHTVGHERLEVCTVSFEEGSSDKNNNQNNHANNAKILHLGDNINAQQTDDNHAKTKNFIDNQGCKMDFGTSNGIQKRTGREIENIIQRRNHGVIHPAHKSKRRKQANPRRHKRHFRAKRSPCEVLRTTCAGHGRGKLRITQGDHHHQSANAY